MDTIAVAVLVIVLMVALVAMMRYRRRYHSRGNGPFEVLFASAEPLALGGCTMVRCMIPDPIEGEWTLDAALVCTEVMPDHTSGAGAATVTVARVVECRHRIVATAPEVVVEIEVEIPLDASPSMTLADHAIEWMLELTVVGPQGRRSTTRHDVVVAPVVAVELLEDHVVGEGDVR